MMWVKDVLSIILSSVMRVEEYEIEKEGVDVLQWSLGSISTGTQEWEELNDELCLLLHN